jgi:hypothetical protein
MSFQDSIVAPGMIPPWMGPVSQAKLKAIGAGLDQLVGVGGKLAQAIEARMPTKCDASALPYIGQDLLIPQGVNESNTSYRGRLRVARPLWKTLAGTPQGVLKATLGCILPLAPRIRHATDTGAWDTYEAGADTTQPPWHVSPLSNMVWDGNGVIVNGTKDPAPAGVIPWWRFYIIIYATDVAWTSSSGTWGSSGKTWGDATKSWGFNTPSAIFRQIQQVIRTWKSNHSWCRWVIVSFDDTLFDPWQAADGVHNTDGRFGRWSKIVGGQYVPARFANARYFNV